MCAARMYSTPAVASRIAAPLSLRLYLYLHLFADAASVLVPDLHPRPSGTL